MTIDWFTIAAEILNFLLLVYLLRRFLYPAIIRAMDKREKLIASRLEEAEAKLKQAKAAEESYARQKQKLADERVQLTAQATEEAGKLRQELSEQARTEVDADKARWREAIQHQKNEFLSLLRLRAAEQVVAIVGRALRDLADEQLEQRIVSKFLERLENTDKKETAAIRKSLKKDKSEVRIASAFELPNDARGRIREVLQARLRIDVEPEYTTSTDVIGGIEISIGESRIAWSLRSYLDDLTQEVSEAVDGVTDEGRGAPA
ncbi:MAG: F0F1 ATP synthase subunit delta [Dehalococcoidia bacterium]|nr:F0F1 ATP synthase subunit delta [Dehalococcoidia bacterium]